MFIFLTRRKLLSQITTRVAVENEKWKWARVREIEKKWKINMLMSEQIEKWVQKKMFSSKATCRTWCMSKVRPTLRSMYVNQCFGRQKKTEIYTCIFRCAIKPVFHYFNAFKWFSLPSLTHTLWASCTYAHIAAQMYMQISWEQLWGVTINQANVIGESWSLQ